ncbi:bifunctional lysylphosphatidylglycerol synthetase/lysine--tRNA ligase LysX [Amycolatopsis cynarae]|uniref:Lysine--tRNA ligase n=1 Tax=Amycolatopsis cynarae TaxID=2995223 RepID=A0ABY7BDZ3_9PSEU|nr:bifunctional lysylphosphatidylglycerol synthetase/lysine--tRNA ligase LysX [Amycolatopsis sp. HUAS 11-8]WAL68843.1 bifunctional lysylphosphatidylglycerol synthetase/lysine--tRNA ligase LysX [Amycolatopsis sp. HUAS 11-8]
MSRRNRAAWVVAAAAELSAVTSLALLLFDRGSNAGEMVIDVFSWLNLPVDGSLVRAVLLAVLGAALRRRKRAALLTLVVLQVTGLALDLAWAVAVRVAPAELLAPGDDVTGVLWPALGSAAVSAGLAVFLWRLRPAFPARLAPGAWWRALVALSAGLISVVALGMALTTVFPGGLFGLWERFAWVTNHATGAFFQLRRLGVGTGPAWVDVLLDALAAATGLAAVVIFFRGVRGRRLATDDEELRLRALLAEHGEDDSLGYFATRRDKSVVFAPSGRAAVAYRVLAGTSVASGDPIGDPAAWPDAVRAWLAEARDYGWVPGVLGASERGAKVYAAAGLRAWELGDEAILHVDDFQLTGPGRRAVRQAVTRVKRAGYTVRIRHHGEIPDEEMARLRARARLWRDGQIERGFSMALERLGDPTDARCVMVEALDAQGELRGLLSFVPWGQRGLSLDLMRRDPGADNGLNEYLIAELVAAGPRLGVRRISLNFAMFRAVFATGDRIGAGPVLRAWHRVLTFASRYLQLESLYRSNVKYGPRWRPRFLCYASPRALTRVGIMAGALEGFLPAGAARRSRADRSLDEEFTAAVRRIEQDAVRRPVADRRRPEQVRVRLAKLARLRAAGLDPYPAAFDRRDDLADIVAKYAWLNPDSQSGHHATVAGRVVAIRDHGGLYFAVIQSFTGRLQLMLDARECDVDAWRAGVDLGDHVGATGEIVTSKTGELSVRVAQWTVTAKCLHPLPDKRKGLTDPEIRARRRYLDLAVNPEASAMLRLRSQVVRALRERLHGGDFLEVETPMLQPVHGGANARPFITHSNAYDTRLYLRIAPELYLKRLCVAGVERVFELNRNFRNEGADATHNPEFTMLEAYQAYTDYHAMRALTRDLVLAAARAAFDAPVALRPDGEHDLSGDWPVVPVYHAVSDALGDPIAPDTPVARLRHLCTQAGVEAPGDAEAADLVLAAYEHLVEPATTGPTFYIDFPAAVSPLTRPHREDARLAERWDLVAFGAEIGTAYTELADPIEQRARLHDQSLRAAGGDPEAMEVDEDFLLALEHGMPPTGGLGLGVDRLLMMLTGASIRQTVLFPFTRPKAL